MQRHDTASTTDCYVERLRSYWKGHIYSEILELTIQQPKHLTTPFGRKFIPSRHFPLTPSISDLLQYTVPSNNLPVSPVPLPVERRNQHFTALTKITQGKSNVITGSVSSLPNYADTRLRPCCGSRPVQFALLQRISLKSNYVGLHDAVTDAFRG
ncbi:hypothetical protein BaRGS_00021728 [Batillaria attramentaria]|uniref:Uncharacterized protein n=1 Tax=Batillaria attramentaria TaxID=370345 RepID=A0ABD0KIL4_9CAEN